MAKEPSQCSGAAHAVPLVTQPAGRQRKRVARFPRLGNWLVDGVDKACTAVGSGNYAVFVKSCFTGRLTRLERLLLRRGVQYCGAHTSDVKITPTGGFAVLVPDGFVARGLVGKAVVE